jgi:hypothetical protein
VTAAKPTAPSRPVSRVLEMSSPIHRRTAELYRERYPVIGAWTDEATWSECWRQASREILGEGS